MLLRNVFIIKQENVSPLPERQTKPIERRQKLAANATL
jgi:hypothetical protein